MKQNLFFQSYKIGSLKCKIPKFEMSMVKLDDVTSAKIKLDYADSKNGCSNIVL